jgi:hypothetical protein
VNCLLFNYNFISEIVKMKFGSEKEEIRAEERGGIK